MQEVGADLKEKKTEKVTCLKKMFTWIGKMFTKKSKKFFYI